MNPMDLVGWVFAIALSLVIVAVAVLVVVAVAREIVNPGASRRAKSKRIDV